MPRIKMTPTVRAALWTLRIYLLALLTLIAIKFIRVFSSPRDQSPSPATESATPGTGKNVRVASELPGLQQPGQPGRPFSSRVSNN